MGIEPTCSAWKADVLPLNYTRLIPALHVMVEGVGFEPTKAEPTDLQSAPVDRLGTPPKFSRPFWEHPPTLSTENNAILKIIHAFLMISPVMASLIRVGFCDPVILPGKI